MNARIILTLLVAFTATVRATDNSGDVFYEEVPSRHGGPQSIEEARALGKAEAERDIKAGRFRVRDCGKPARPHETDPITGYPIEYTGPCKEQPGPSPWPTARIFPESPIPISAGFWTDALPHW